MDDIEDRSRKDARTVEITTALVLGTLVVVLPWIALRLVATANWGGDDWSAVKRTVHSGALLAGAAVTVWWLVRSGRDQQA